MNDAILTAALRLPMESVRNCRILPDREDILRYLPKDIVFVEIGVALGDFTEKVLQQCNIRQFVAIDIFTMHHFPHAWGGMVGEVLGDLEHLAFYEKRFSKQIEAGCMKLLAGDSKACIAELADQSVDVFYVNADHAYEAVKAELAVIRRKIVPGGLIILNDYTMFDQFRMLPYGVVQAAHEFMVEHGWEMIFLALHTEMFCTVVLRERPDAGAALMRYSIATRIYAKPDKPSEPVPETAGGPTIINLPDPDLGSVALEILALLRPMDPVGAALVRKGRDNDGGYVMLDHILENSVVYSLGISDDVSWDLEMAALGCDIFQYDHTIAALPVEHANFHFFRTGIAAISSDDGSFRSLDDLIRINGHEDCYNIILKMDIEGSEWPVFATLGETTLTQFSQIIIEMHNFLGIAELDKRQEIFSSLRRLQATHQVVHVHANNYGWLGVIGGVFMPDTFEVTFARRSDLKFTACFRSFPTPLDMPCDPNSADFFLGCLGLIGGGYPDSMPTCNAGV